MNYGRGVTTVPELTSERLSAEFPGNEWLVADIYAKYKADKSSVDAKWVQIFERLEATPASAGAKPAARENATAPGKRTAPDSSGTSDAKPANAAAAKLGSA